jgi:long-chain-fatty-acid--CoA ligase ACSBG
MISHDNLCYTVRYIGELSNLVPYNERIISYLPLSHIAAQLLDIFIPMHFGATIYFANPDALKGSLNRTMTEVKPTYFLGVPRVWEKIQENIVKETKALSGIKLALFEWARKAATDNVHNQFHGSKKTSISFRLAKSLILNAILHKLGLDQCRNFMSGAAPITKDTLDFFIGLGIPLCEAYGLSESTGPHNVGYHLQNRICSIGPVRIFNKSKILNQSSDGSGELGIYGRHVFMGYLKDEAKSKETIDEEGWLRSGDLAKIDDGFLFITGRLKELIITAGGENVAPVPIEDSIKAELPDLISNCMLVGDKRKYLTVLVTLKNKINLETMEPLDELTDVCINYLKCLGTSMKTVSSIVGARDPTVYKTIENGK